jgi:signal transduction histidine kinase
MYVEGDAFKLIKVFQNVISNSIDAMPGGGKLQISGEASGRHVVVRILDTGHGISKKDLPKLFEPFFTTKAKGMGLGLTISRRIVEAHGGTIDISSKEGEGTVVVITLPASAPPEGKDSDTRKAELGYTPFGSGERIERQSS